MTYTIWRRTGVAKDSKDSYELLVPSPKAASASSSTENAKVKEERNVEMEMSLATLRSQVSTLCLKVHVVYKVYKVYIVICGGEMK